MQYARILSWPRPSVFRSVATTLLPQKRNIGPGRCILQSLYTGPEKLCSAGGNVVGKQKTQDVTSLVKQLQARIKVAGPITVSSYMKEVLTNPLSGYYMNKDVFGESGDFTTSPEISPLFGEMIAVWLLSEWKKAGSPRPVQLIELGPGRGTLIHDVLRVFGQFQELDGVTLHLVEISPHLSDLQANKLGVEDTNVDTAKLHYRCGRTNQDVPVFWYSHIQDVPRGFCLLVGHEFFDALPIHKFKKTDDGWREILVDIDPDGGAEKFRYVMSRSATPASIAFIKPDEKREHVEICPEASVILQHLAVRLEEDGGIALFADYGHDGTKTDTFRAFRNHKLHDPLKEPGTADLTADVDFSAMRDAVANKLLTFGPISQQDFLKNMGIDVRLEILLNSCDEEQKESLKSGYHMIMDSGKMGKCFQFFSMFPGVLKEHLNRFPVSGFSQ